MGLRGYGRRLIDRERQRVLRRIDGLEVDQALPERIDHRQLAFKRGQGTEIEQAEIVQELARGGEQRRAPHHIFRADHFDPATILQRLDDLGRDGHAPDLFNIAAGHGLAVRNDGQRLQDRTRILRRALGVQPLDVPGDVRRTLEAPAPCQRHQHHPAPFPFPAQLIEQGAQRICAHLKIVGKKLAQLRQRQRLLSTQQCGLDDALDVRSVHHAALGSVMADRRPQRAGC